MLTLHSGTRDLRTSWCNSRQIGYGCGCKGQNRDLGVEKKIMPYLGELQRGGGWTSNKHYFCLGVKTH